jgi:hypothetical protein
MLVVVLITFIHTRVRSLDSNLITKYNKNFGKIILFFVLLYMGLRPIHGVFVDMITYNRGFIRYAEGAMIVSANDLFFHVFTKFLSSFVSASTYFFLCATLYVVPLYVVCKKWFHSYWLYGFLFLVCAFSFWAYGTNGIRNGIAGSLFLLGVSREKRFWQVIWFVLAIGFHKTMLLPIAGFVLSNFCNQPKTMIVFWALCVPLSLIGGGFFESFFGSIGFDDERMGYFNSEIEEGKFSSTGFRWDFLLYSSAGVFAGWFYIVKRKYNDKIYFILFNTYLFANAFWILVIRASYSNRFAYLSWFMIGLVIIYPLLKQNIIKGQHKKIGLILIVYFAFTFLMNVILN